MTRQEALELLEADLAKQLQTERDRGMIDLKCMCAVDGDSSTALYAWTLSNALKYRHTAEAVSLDELNF